MIPSTVSNTAYLASSPAVLYLIPQPAAKKINSPFSGSESNPKFPPMPPDILLFIFPTMVRQVTSLYLTEMAFAHGHVISQCAGCRRWAPSASTFLLVIREVGKLKAHFLNPFQLGCWV